MSGIIGAGAVNNSGVVNRFPTGHVLRAWYNESDAAYQTFTNNTTTYWDELALAIEGGGEPTDYLQVTINLNGIYNGEDLGVILWVGVQVDDDENFSSSTRFGTIDTYTRTLYVGSALGLNIDGSWTIRALHPYNRNYWVRPRIYVSSGNLNINQSNTKSTINALEIKGAP